ncbi:NAD(P)-binding domain-containing protein, partial [Oleiphilus sp. HI0079]|uniref:NAD(P)-binding domain-containing protein n=3 Tax=Oleiphilus TaxID=141450 RepID=UPI000B12E492
TGEVVESVLMQEGVLDSISAGSLVIDMSSIPPEQARSHASRLHERSIRYLDAPVSGGTVGAAEASLSIMAGGERADVEYANSIFSALGKATHIGAHGCGQLA